jgi:hypothetical protein
MSGYKFLGSILFICAYGSREAFEEMPPDHQGPRPTRRSSLSVVQSNEFQIFLGDSEMMGIVPTAAKDGDVTCHSLNCDADVVMRPQGERFLFIGRALVFRREGSRTTRFNEQTSKEFKYFVPNQKELPARTRDMSIYADVATLQLLTK